MIEQFSEDAMRRIARSVFWTEARAVVDPIRARGRRPIRENPPATVTGPTLNLVNLQNCFAATVAAGTSKVVEWTGGGVTGSSVGFTLANDATLGAHGGTYNCCSPGAVSVLMAASICVSGSLANQGRVDLYLLWKAGGGGLGASVIAASTIFVQTADVGKALVLSCAGLILSDGTGSDRVYAVIYNDTAGAFTFGGSRLPLGIDQSMYVSTVSAAP